ncbi:MAG: hypothetical protein HQK83_13085 [Fibrobacteria bacterium]|nr:hypothetical protein [Fibrobacteria bacterium]
MSEDKEVILEGKIWAIMSYLWILCLIPLILKKDNEFSFFHARQGLVLFVASIICAGLMMVPFINFIVPTIHLLIFVFSLMGIFNALMGKYWKIPIIGKYAERIEL